MSSYCQGHTLNIDILSDLYNVLPFYIVKFSVMEYSVF